MLHLFDAVGIELEYMIVGRDTLDVRSIADRLFEAQTGRITGDAALDDVTWSNELVAHVVELKTSAPAADLSPLPAAFHRHVQRVNGLLAPMGARLMPTAMHPWMDPHRQTVLWAHDNRDIYDAFNRIFDCRGHGWANLQSMHINLPFAGDEEFARLHAAIRLLLPILPALAASSPIIDGRITGVSDSRLAAYRANCARVPSVTARVVPEPVFTRADYERDILGRIYADMAPLDPAGVLREEFANARGAIARFSRGSIEVRVLDVQECPAADLAIAAAVVAVLELIVAERWSPLAAQQAWATDPLADLFDGCVRDGERFVITDAAYLRVLGWEGSGRCSAAHLWRRLIDQADRADPSALGWCRQPLETILTHGPLSRRIVRAVGPGATPEALRVVYARLCDCLAHGEMF